MNRKRKDLISLGIISMALVGYTIGNIAPILPRYIDRIEYVDGIEYVDKTSKNSWTIKIELWNVTAGNIDVYEKPLLNAEYESQNVTIQFYFVSSESIRIKFVLWIDAYGTEGWIGEGGNFYNSTQWIEFDTYDATIYTDEVKWSPEWQFTTPDTIGTYNLRIVIRIFETTIL
ncbi:MAG: hypothetical protein JSV12_05800 [Candidatus Bathyarchaeota archaeon]|nr:MAG: hypothetical protein JSV12_05800 [Candidatus Bathyarchaeota archaeon]